ncbi:MAG: zinc-dependent metalloprotease [Acidothermus sp.]|nr:zinc-dependent metalloprotease [Acidothermus sp.]MCL6537713.1 zinc-dependent metalloprotease [Acidothermus sp.]
MTDDNVLIDWEVATATAVRLAPKGPAVTRREAFDAVQQLRSLAAEASGHVTAVTRLRIPDDQPPARVVDRTGWIRGNVGGFRVVLRPLLEKLAAKSEGVPGSGLLRGVGAKITGAQFGVVLAYLSGKVLGQYEIFLPPDGGTTPPGRLSLVAPNIVAVERELGVDPRDFRLWVCIHEAAHRAQFTAVPWLRSHVQDEVAAYLVEAELDSAALFARLRSAAQTIRERGLDGGRDFPLGLLDVVHTPRQRDILRRLTALMTLLEGHGEYVMNAVGAAVIPTIDEIREKFAARRAGRNAADRLVRRLFGLDIKARQYAEGARFVDAVVEAAGMDAFNRVWTSPNTLPTKEEIAEPERWMARVLHTDASSR